MDAQRMKVVRFWLDSAQDDWDFAVEIWQSGKRLHNALYFAQLALEKTIKALHYYKKEDHPLLTHDLALLAKKASLEINEKEKEAFKEISSFNVSVRYDDDKRSFRKKATQEYVDEWMKRASEIRRYLLLMIGD